MAKKIKSLVPVASKTLHLASRRLKPYSSLKSPHKFKQAQLLTCLVLRAYCKTTYRGVIEILAASKSLRSTIGLSKVPHYSTLKYFEARRGIIHLVDYILSEVT